MYYTYMDYDAQGELIIKIEKLYNKIARRMDYIDKVNRVIVNSSS